MREAIRWILRAIFAPLWICARIVIVMTDAITWLILFVSGEIE